MSTVTRIFIVGNIKLPIDASHEEAFSVSKKKLIKIGADVSNAKYRIYRKSIDARNKNNIQFVYSVAVSNVSLNKNPDFLKEIGISELSSCNKIEIEKGNALLKGRPLIVGAGPAGLFAALLLAENGYTPILIERGGCIKERKAAVNLFNTHQILDTETNIQFGAGGAGTFSDGKLVTRINDPLCDYVLSKFVCFGAPDDITYIAKPHIGTDILSEIVEKISERICELGGDVLYHTKYIDSKHENGEHVAITSAGDIKYGALILAIGHSARDTYRTILEKGFAIEAKDFSVGMRIEHLAKDIDNSLYGKFAGHPALGHAEYNLSCNTKQRGVYTFCMCPGGEVVAAASEIGGICVNGMSNRNRDSSNSNSAILSTVFASDYGSNPHKAIEFQQHIEQSAFKSAGSNYHAPIITVGDFVNGECKTLPTKVNPSYMGGVGVSLTSPSLYLPSFVTENIKQALKHFNTRIYGFSADYAILTGPETRTSAPIRILRDNTTRLALGTDNIYPAGEGAGYAGGITSAAIDGLKTAIEIIKKYAPLSHDR